MQLHQRARPAIGGVASKTAAKDAEFTDYLHARQPSLLPQGVQCTGSPA